MSPNDEYDSPWKQLIEWYFEPFMHFFFPAAHAQIDWQHSVQFLDKELYSRLPSMAGYPLGGAHGVKGITTHQL